MNSIMPDDLARYKDSIGRMIERLELLKSNLRAPLAPASRQAAICYIKSTPESDLLHGMIDDLTYPSNSQTSQTLPKSLKSEFIRPARAGKRPTRTPKVCSTEGEVPAVDRGKRMAKSPSKIRCQYGQPLRHSNSYVYKPEVSDDEAPATSTEGKASNFW